MVTLEEMDVIQNGLIAIRKRINSGNWRIGDHRMLKEQTELLARYQKEYNDQFF